MRRVEGGPARGGAILDASPEDLLGAWNLRAVLDALSDRTVRTLTLRYPARVRVGVNAEGAREAYIEIAAPLPITITTYWVSHGTEYEVTLRVGESRIAHRSTVLQEALERVFSRLADEVRRATTLVSLVGRDAVKGRGGNVTLDVANNLDAASDLVVVASIAWPRAGEGEGR